MGSGLKKKLRKIGAVLMAAAMMLGLLQAVPAGALMLSAKAETVGDKTWNFRAATAAQVQLIQNSVGEFEGLQIDATNGKLSIREGDWAQFNKGTIIKVPVDGHCMITVENYDVNYTIDGTAATDKTTEYEYKGEAGYVEIAATANSYIGSIKTVHIAAPTLDTSKVDVWDFGGEALEGAYNNNINYDFINSCYPGVEAGTTGKNITSFTALDGAGKEALKYVTNKTNNRWRLTPASDAKVTCYDNKVKVTADGTVFSGFLYSNNSGATPLSVNPASTNQSQVEFYLYEGDVLTCWLGSNGNAAKYSLVDENGVEVGSFDYSGKNQIEEAKFYGAEEGWYTLYCTNEKLVLARAYREHTPVVTVSGTVTAPESLNDYSLVFTNKLSGKTVTAKVTDGKYTASLNGKYTYDVTLKDANGYVIDSEASVEVGTENKSFDVHIKAVDLLTVTGKISGLTTAALEKLELVFENSSAIYVPEIAIDTTTGDYTLKVEKGVKYAVSALNINDFTLNTTEVTYDAAKTDDKISFTAKPVYKANVSFTGLKGVDTSTAKVTFTNINEEGYAYTYGMNEDMMLRDGQYKVSVTGLAKYNYVQGVTPDIKIDGASGVTVAPFTAIDDWTISSLTGANQIETYDDASYFAGLKLEGKIALNKGIYLLTNADSKVTIPNVKKGDVITLSYCYCASFKIGDVVVDEKSGSTSKIDSVTYTATEDGDVVIETLTGTNSVQTYFTSISVAAVKDEVPYTSEIKVGADKEYKTINEALTAVRHMVRTEDQKVTIMIDPGNYEEMLVIDTPNVSLVNASINPSIELKNKGVDIDDNAVRITWYYGHGYTYYSMGNDSKFDAELLAANKANGYESYVNTGSGTTNGSYWNATVVVSASNVSADGIIFENSFNQYVSAASVNDKIVSQSGAKNGSVLRDDMKTVGDTTVQDKKYVERAAALAIYNAMDNIYFSNCKFIGRQDTLYGGTGVKATFDKCSVYGGTDYIFGGMTAVFNKCDLVFNTSDDKNDVGYITAPQQTSGRGYLMESCHVTSTVPGVDTASEHTSKPGYFGRPWQSNTGEAVFKNTVIDAADEYWSSTENTTGTDLGKSLIMSAGWLSTLSGESALCSEYGTIEKSEVDNSENRVSWAAVFTTAKLADGTDMTTEAFLGANTLAVDTSKLDEAVAAATKTADVSKYTADSVKNVTDILEAVKANQGNMSQDRVNAYVVALDAAVKNLTALPEEEPAQEETKPAQTETKPAQTEAAKPAQTVTQPAQATTVAAEAGEKVTETVAAKTETAENNNTVKSGDTTQAVIYILLVIAAVGVVGFEVVSRRRKIED